MRMSHHGDPPTRFDHPDHLPQHPVGIDPLDHGTRHGDIKAVVWEGQRFGAPFPELNDILQPFLPGQRHGLTEHIAADVETDDTICPTRMTGQPAVQNPGPTPHFEDALPRLQLGLLDKMAHYSQVSSGAAAGFETADHSQVGTAEGNRTPALAEPGYERLPL